MWTLGHWKILFVLSFICFGAMIYSEGEVRERIDLPALEAAQMEEIEAVVAQEVSNYQEGKLRLNQASKEKLIELPGVGPVIADRIIQYRSAKGGFSSIEELRNIKGIGPKKMEAIRGQVTLE